MSPPRQLTRAGHPFRRGDVVLVPFPFADLSAQKRRPALVVSSPLYHQTEPDLILAAITGRIPATPAPTDYVLQDWQQAGLLRPSMVKAFLVTVEPRVILHRLGRLSRRDLREVAARLRLALDL